MMGSGQVVRCSLLERGFPVIHQYKNNGYNIVLDVNSGAVHVVDDVVYDVLPHLEKKESAGQIRKALEGRYSQEEIDSAVSECRELEQAGVLKLQSAVSE